MDQPVDHKLHIVTDTKVIFKNVYQKGITKQHYKVAQAPFGKKIEACTRQSKAVSAGSERAWRPTGAGLATTTPRAVQCGLKNMRFFAKQKHSRET